MSNIKTSSTIEMLKASAGYFRDDAGQRRCAEAVVVVKGKHVCPVVAGKAQALNPVESKDGKLPQMSSFSQGGTIRLDKHGGDYETALEEYKASLTPGLGHEVELVRLFD